MTHPKGEKPPIRQILHHSLLLCAVSATFGLRLSALPVISVIYLTARLFLPYPDSSRARLDTS
jgi:hypothetical protein